MIEALADVMVMRGVPDHLRSDNGPEFVARDLRKWLAHTGAKTLYIEPGSPWENGYCESFNSKLRDEFLNGETLLLDKRNPGAGRTLAHPLQHRQATLLARLSATSAGGMAGGIDYRAWRSGKQSTLPTSPHPRRRLLDLKRSCATLTSNLVQKIGQSSPRAYSPR